MMKSVLPFLMFQGEGVEALGFYQSVFPEARIETIEHYGPGEAGAEGTIRRSRFRLGDQTVLCFDSGIRHAFTFTPSFSFWIDCESEAEVRRLSEALKAGGAELMPAANYGFSVLFAWVSDRFGVSWQLNFG